MLNRGFLFLGLMLPSLVLADADSWLAKDKININLGVFVTDYDTDGRLSSSRGVGTKISFEDDLGLDDSQTVLRLDTSFRIAARHSLQFSYLDLSRDGKFVTERNLLIDGTFYPTGSRLDINFEYQVYKFAYTYSIWQETGYDLGFTTGLHIFEFDLGIESEIAKEEGDNGTSPFPMFGLRGNWQLAPQMFMRGSIEYFEISDGDIEGRLIDYMLSIEYRFDETWGAGLGYNKLDLDVEDTDSRDELAYEYDGVVVYLNLRF